MQQDIIFTEIKGAGGNIGHITLNRPQVLNAMTTSMCAAVYKKLEEWEANANIKAVIVTGNGERAFCAGGDIKHFYEMGKPGIEKSKEFFWQEYRMNYRIGTFKKPYIALMHGITMGGGAGVSINGSHRVAAENFIFAMPETAIGLHPDIGAGYFLTRCLDNMGFYLGLTGNKINVGDAHYVGLIDAVVPQEKFSELIQALAETGFSNDPVASVSNIIAKFNISPPPSELATHRKIIEECFEKETIEEIIAALQQQNTPFTNETVTELLHRSPTSLKVTLKQLRQSRDLDLADCIKLDYRLTMHFLENADFYEGIRAAVVDKDRNPKWQPSKLDEVSSKIVESYFLAIKKELVF